MGKTDSTAKSDLNRRLRRATWLSVAALVPYCAFIAILSFVPEILARRPIESSPASLALYLALVLFAWPVIIAIYYARTATR